MGQRIRFKITLILLRIAGKFARFDVSGEEGTFIIAPTDQRQQTRDSWDRMLHGDWRYDVGASLFMLLGILLFGSVGYNYLSDFVQRRQPIILLSFVPFLIGAGVFIVPGTMALVLRRLLRRMIPKDALSERLNTDYVTLNRALRDGHVRPRLIIDGESYYHASDFGDIATLLRASAAPAPAADTLLRAATGDTEALTVKPEELLRSPVSDVPPATPQAVSVHTTELPASLAVPSEAPLQNVRAGSSSGQE